jgi:TfoX/Sxy family transcriptional regulator of competence genes
MAYDDELAERVRDLLAGQADVTEKRMFGGLAMLRGGNMAVAIRGGGGLMVRVDPADEDEALAEPGAALAVMRGRPMAGWVVVETARVAGAADLKRWVMRGITYAATLPPK